MRQLKRRGDPEALADPGNDGLAREPGLVPGGALPGGRGEDARGLADQVDAGRRTEPELGEVAGHSLDAEVHGERIEVRVHRLRDRLHEIDPAVSAATMVTVLARLARQAVGPRGEHGVLGLPQPQFEPGKPDEGLQRAARLIAAKQHPVEQRTQRRIEKLRIGGARDPVDERVGVVAGQARHRQHLAVARIEDDRGAWLIPERSHDSLLQRQIDAQVQVLSGAGR